MGEPQPYGCTMLPEFKSENSLQVGSVAFTHNVNKYHHYNQHVGGMAGPLHAHIMMLALEIGLIAIKLRDPDLNYSELLLCFHDYEQLHNSFLGNS